MKNILLFIFFFSLKFLGHAQGIILEMDEYSFTASEDTPFEIPVTLYNDFDYPTKVLVEWQSEMIEMQDRSVILHGDHAIETGKISLELKAHEKVSDLLMRITCKGGTENRIFTLTITDLSTMEAIEEEISVDVKSSAPNLIFKDESLTVGGIYPNPIVNYAWLTYEVITNTDAKIVIHNILGNFVDEIKLSPLDRKVKIDATNYKEGVYFYSLIIEGQSKSTRKIVVQR
ncbi:T9SS type A sorting domain-containing protein [Persicobacter psychrovividus]|uniref:Secretion system C-terminal sorting domain-containing protein n=1 Tax=Persicobacter psychrovividus TaxID=387638 RepID=A0ABM7VHH3_9BACT|nr:hypothetical protein PEPS_26950 [Persicobacter psychrovividus]